ncbi:MAG: hypothetical protein HY678_00995 [Chloroflexi bacterium]|nr:hypothetical protein [Chloroflexota bacterium]
MSQAERSPSRARPTRVLVAVVALAVFVGVVVAVHEGAHIAVALASGVPLSDIHWGGFRGINPAINYDTFPTDWRRPAIYYAGGLAGAAVAMIVYWLALTRYRRTGTFFAWTIALLVMAVVGHQVGNAIAEGAFHDAYLDASVLTAYVQAIPAWLAASIHAAWLAPILPLARRMRRPVQAGRINRTDP